MNSKRQDIALAYLTLLCGLTISAVAIWYSVAGLVAIFAAAAIPIIIMGTVLEASKLIATIWLKWNWHRAPKLIKSYLLTAIGILMLLTSMGIFGFLSKAHLDQTVPTGDIAAKVALIDEKIATEKQNIELARKAIAQLDSAVDQTLIRSTSESGANRAAQIRRSQQKERSQLQLEISKSQKAISLLNEERAPIAAQLRKVEAEVGPIKYIAALIYGDNPENNLLEKAVRWVIIIIVLVFDPLAVILLLASQHSFQWARSHQTTTVSTPEVPNVEESEEQSDVVDVPKEPASSPIVLPSISNTEELKFPEFNSIKVTPVEVVNPSFAFRESELPLVADKTEEVVAQVEPELEPEIPDEIPLAEKEAMKKWKEKNPNESLKHQRRLFELKLIDKLPWQEEPATPPNYVQNAEQGSNTIWQRLKNIKK